jgi:hypothetical protein
MLYEIVSYDETRMIVIVKVAQNADELAYAQHLPISLFNLSDKDQFEKQVYLTWKSSWPARTLAKPYDALLENHIIDNVGSKREFEILIIPAELAQSADELGVNHIGPDDTIQVL